MGKLLETDLPTEVVNYVRNYQDRFDRPDKYY